MADGQDNMERPMLNDVAGDEEQKYENTHHQTHDPEITVVKKTRLRCCPLIGTVFLICLSSFIFGYDTIQSTLLINDDNSSYHADHKGALNYNDRIPITSPVQKSLIRASTLIGATIGSFSMFVYSSCRPITYKFSRKQILIYSNSPIILGALITFIAIKLPYSWIVITGLILQGIGVGISSIIAPILIAEISPCSVRPFLTWFSQLFITFGMLVSAVVSWRLMLVDYGWLFIVAIGIVPAFIQFGLQRFICKSPRLLLAHSYLNADNNQDQQMEAQLILRRFYANTRDADDIYEKIKKRMYSNRDKCMHDGFWRYRTSFESADRMQSTCFLEAGVVGIVMNALQQLTGCNVIFYNSQSIISHSINERDFLYNGLIWIYAVNFLATLMSVMLVKFYNVKHKPMLYVGCSLMLSSILFLAIIKIDVDSFDTHQCNGNHQQKLIDMLSMNKLPFYVFGYAMSVSGYTWLLNTELFPMCHRIQYGSLCVFIQWLCNMMISLIVLNINVDTIIMYFVCCGTIAIAIVFISLFIQETKNQPLELAVRLHNAPLAPSIIWVP